MTKPVAARAKRSSLATDVDDLVTAVLTASRVLVGVSVRSLAQVEGMVTATQLRTLVVLDGHGEMNLNRLAELLGVTPSTAMRMIDRLLNAGLVTRRDNPANRREVVLGLTDQGRQVVREVTSARLAEIARIVKAMPAEQRAGLIQALRAFAEAAGEPEPSAGSMAALGW
ncbi:MAG TPA: MarR family transcriptional regulator [Jatrophihabitans sp.]|nr:MarR family transcriptional regulator [Jatrophihabitans sp.]